MKYFRKTNRWIPRSMILCMIVWGAVCLVYCPAADAEAEPFQIVLFVSKNIRPYVEAVDGLRDQLDALSLDVNVEIIMLDRYGDTSKEDLANRFAGEIKLDLVGAIGPEAAAFIWETFQGAAVPKIYAIILNPEKVISGIESAIGISLNIPPADQLHVIRQSFPFARRIGILYDPAYNSDFFAAASAAALEQDVEIVPMTASSKKDIPFLLEQCWDSVDCIWLIPDRTVISESIAQYIIKQAILQKVPVVGYNQFFYDSGAAMAFVFDYRELGRQAARLIADVLRQKAAGPRNPVFTVRRNETVLKKLGLSVAPPVTSPAMVSP